jgi:hypothetical protein
MANFVLTAGARLGAWAWDEVVPYLRAAGHGAHPLTLSGLAHKRGVPAGQQTHVQDIVHEAGLGSFAIATVAALIVQTVTMFAIPAAPALHERPTD